MLHRWDHSEVLSLDSCVKLQQPQLQKFWDKFDSIAKGLLSLEDSFGAELAKLRQAILHYDRFARDEILQQHDHFRLVGQDNYRRYLAISPMHLRVESSDSVWGVLARCAAAVATGGGAVVSYAPAMDDSKIEAYEKATLGWAGKIEWIEQTEEDLCQELRRGTIQRLRYDGGSKVTDKVRAEASKHYVYVADAPVSFEDLELLWYVVEQSISLDYHRYGNLGPRSEEPRSPVL
jgi:RHH-type proline utilization regulon transcriptional repressor/proline dehydrogenase/delta 1-pyrroline-5-carboxylate dehydrogenase